jgi:hypothetical protein
MAMLPFGDLGGAALALATDGGVVLAQIDGDSLAVRRGARIAGANANANANAALATSADGRCVALLDGEGRWLEAVRRGE